MKDRFKLILAASVISAIAWSFWHVLAKDAFSALPTIMLIIVAADNLRLRRQLRSNIRQGDAA
jgi:phage/plasmid primase-like uncharacterized protein